MYEKILEAGRSPFSHTLLFPLCQVRDWPSTSNDAFYSGAMSYLMEFRLRPDPIAPRKTLTNHASEAVGVAGGHAQLQQARALLRSCFRALVGVSCQVPVNQTG